ncbi:hypothetical protein CIW49_26495 [Mycolicibacterium sp. P1-18]|uniref:Imm61 family immunity protein n=1 Tax=Mycolicibacterium sp. P1-18 TaxID=2024615 RepID=UPI0011F324F0|nr:Imm61 family immunity protein [Mycolicibacterium sp. P1-18]KAA0093612.1 hypothetical protein CIW49_26495 [Mycolicibacterium sp. P1-18]
MTDVLGFSDPRVLRAIELIWREAALLDAKDYLQWESMYTDDARYVVPIDPDTEDFESSLNMVYDDKRMRRLRVERMLQGYSQSAVAAARTVRVVSRFTVESVTDDAVTLKSAQILSAFKRNKFTTIGAELRERVLYAASAEVLERFVMGLLGDDIRDDLDLPYLELPSAAADVARGYSLGPLESGSRTLFRGVEPVAAAPGLSTSVAALVPLSHFLGHTVDDLRRSYLSERGAPLLGAGGYAGC